MYADTISKDQLNLTVETIFFVVTVTQKINDITVVKSKEIVFRVSVFFSKKKKRTFFQTHKYQD